MEERNYKNKGGRPKKKEEDKVNKKITIWLNSKEEEILFKNIPDRISKNKFLKALLFKSEKTFLEKGIDYSLIYQLNKIGNNFNQIAKKINFSNEIKEEDKIEYLNTVEQITELLDILIQKR